MKVAIGNDRLWIVVIVVEIVVKLRRDWRAVSRQIGMQRLKAIVHDRDGYPVPKSRVYRAITDQATPNTVTTS